MTTDAGYFERGFGIDADAMRRVLAEALGSGGDWADLYFQHRQGMSVGFEDDIVNSASSSVDLGVGIRVVTGDQTGYAFSEDLSAASMIAAARTAASIASRCPGAPPQALGAQPLPAHYDTAFDWQAVGVSQVAPMLRDINTQARALDPRVRRVSISFASQQSRVLIADSDGRLSFDNQPMTRLFVSVVMEDNGQRQSNSYNVAARAGLAFYTPERVARVVAQAVAKTQILFEARTPPAGEMPVVLAAGSAGILLHEAIGHGMEADFNRKGTSIFADRIGKPVASPLVTIIDSGLDHGARGAINVDDEGNLPQETVLVRGGVLESYLHDRISARHYGVAPTGSGRRQSFRHMPLPRMRSTYMQAGPHSRDEIIRSVKRGIFCESFTNGQVKIGEGDYTFYVKNGYLIEDGKLTAPIKDVNIIGNGPESLRRIEMVGDDFRMDEGGWTCGKDGQSVPVSLGMPTVLVSGITVGGQA
jgi:TldD protein